MYFVSCTNFLHDEPYFIEVINSLFTRSNVKYYNGSRRTRFHIYHAVFCADEPHIKLYLKVFNYTHIEEHETFLQETQNNSETTLFNVSLKASDDVV